MTESITINNQIKELSIEQLIEHIMENHLQEERYLIREVDKLLNRIIIAHYNHDRDLVLLLHRNFSELKIELEQFFAREEKEYFKAILETTLSKEKNDVIQTNIAEMKSYQSDIEEIIDRLIKGINNFTLPDFACPTMKLAYSKLQELIENVSLQFTLENTVLFTHFE